MNLDGLSEWELKVKIAELTISNTETQLALNTQDLQFFLEKAELKKQVASLIVTKDAVYEERQKCISLIARMAIALGLTAGLGKHEESDLSWEKDWCNIVYIDLPSGQVSWHIHDSDLPLFSFLPSYDRPWDGHSTEEKYNRVTEPKL
jgi:hypothetical protein